MLAMRRHAFWLLYLLSLVVAQHGNDDVPSIKLQQGLPETSRLSRQAIKAWDDALNSLIDWAEAKARSKGQHSNGIPGTAIDDAHDARDVQIYLDCMVSEGEWVYAGDSSQESSSPLLVHKQQAIFNACDKRFYKHHDHVDKRDWNVRDSLKWIWRPSASCSQLAPRLPPDTEPTKPSRLRFCELLAHKSMLLVGDLTHYELHDLLLDFTTTQPASCYGSLYCSEHLLCSDVLRKGIDDFRDDERVYDRLPDPPRTLRSGKGEPREARDGGEGLLLKKRGMEKARSVSHGTLLRFARSDGMRFAGPYTVSSYIHPYTGIREPNHKWLNDAHRSDVIVLTKPPLPLPLPGANADWHDWWSGAQSKTKYDKATRIIEAARKITEDVWLPEFIETIQAVRSAGDEQGSSSDQLVVYRSRWLTHPDCASHTASSSIRTGTTSPGDGPPLHASRPTLDRLLDTAETDEHSAFHNAQVILQNHLARTIVQHFGGVYLDFETLLSVWRSGMVGSSEGETWSVQSSSSSFVDQSGSHKSGLRSAASGDCHRYCLPNPALEEAWLGALQRLFEIGWGGRAEWEGNEFISAKQRYDAKHGRA